MFPRESNPTQYQREKDQWKKDINSGLVVSRGLDEYGNIVSRRPTADYNMYLSADHIGVQAKKPRDTAEA